MVDKQIDAAVSKLSRITQRAQHVLFSLPYIVFCQAILFNRTQLAKVVSNDAQLIQLLRNFTGRLGVIKNSSYERYAYLNFPKADVVSFNTWDEVLRAVISGDVIGAYRDEMEFEKVIEKDPSSNLYLKLAVLDDYTDAIAIAISPNDPHFMFFINFVLQSMNIPTKSKDLLKAYRSVRPANYTGD